MYSLLDLISPDLQVGRSRAGSLVGCLWAKPGGTGIGKTETHQQQTTHLYSGSSISFSLYLSPFLFALYLSLSISFLSLYLLSVSLCFPILSSLCPRILSDRLRLSFRLRTWWLRVCRAALDKVARGWAQRSSSGSRSSGEGSSSGFSRRSPSNSRGEPQESEGRQRTLGDPGVPYACGLPVTYNSKIPSNEIECTPSPQ